MRVPLTWTHDGVTVTKTFVFRRGSYAIGVEYEVHNAGPVAWDGRAYAQILRNDPPTKRSMFNVESYAFHGPAFYDGTKYQKLDTGARTSHLAHRVTNGWIAALQHYFVSAIVPPRGAPWHFTPSDAGRPVPARRYRAGPDRGSRGERQVQADALRRARSCRRSSTATSPELGRVADYGRLWFLARPLFVVLSWVHGVTGNWGIAIIVVTFLLKLLFYPLSEASGRSMAKMKALQPRIKNLQDTYKDDREKLGKRDDGAVPAREDQPGGGCLPIIIQIPVFLAFYWALLESVEMRQAPSCCGSTTCPRATRCSSCRRSWRGHVRAVQVESRARRTRCRPRCSCSCRSSMSVMFAFFPAGLVLYWVTNTFLSIAQQWNINRRIAAATAARRS